MEVEAYHLAGLQEIAILKAQLSELWGTETTRTEYHPQEDGVDTLVSVRVAEPMESLRLVDSVSVVI